MNELHDLQKTSTDGAGKKVITPTQLISRTLRGEAVRIQGGNGAVSIERLDAGHYSVNGEGRHTLEGLKVWLGSYHYEFGEAVFWPA